MPGGTLTYYALSALLAFIPALIWLIVLFKNNKKKGIQLVIFLSGVFSVGLVFGLQFFLNLFPQFDILNFLQAGITDPNLGFILLFIAVVITE